MPDAPHNLHPKYRADIDGLRAVAVLAVVAFHAFPSLIPGGFVGVDVFFVISGFLITGIILGSLGQGGFSFADFYARRIRRIFPALVVVLAASLAIGWFALLPDEYRQLGKHVVGGGAFASNFVLWSESGYFDNAAETKPLLHLWSLGVEEQFYLVWPAFLFVAWRLRERLPWAIVTVLIASFALNLVLTATEPVAAFYSPATRLWELASGALLAVQALRGGDPVRGRSQAAAAVGLALVVTGFFLIKAGRAFPGGWVLLPVIGTWLLIAAGPNSWINQKFLSQRPLVWIGLISYPLYLWHWPLLSFAHIVESGTSSPALRIAAVAASMVLAWGTYRLVEVPIRFGARRRANTSAACGAMLAFGLAGLAVYVGGGLPFRQPEIAEAPREATSSSQQAALPLYLQRLSIDPQYVEHLDEARDRAIRAPRCHPNDDSQTFADYLAHADECLAVVDGKKNVFVIGDSHAADMYAVLSTAYPEINFLQATGPGCVPYNKAGLLDGCRELLAYALNFAESHPIDAVVLSAKWEADYYWMLSNILRLQNRGLKIVVVGPPVEFSADVPKIIQRRPSAELLDSYLAARLDPAPKAREQEMAEFAKEREVGFLPYVALFCADGSCPALNDGGELLIFDKSHLSVPGAVYLGEKIRRSHALEQFLSVQ